LDLLRKILKDGTNHTREYCVYCKVAMAVPVELHRKHVAAGLETGQQKQGFVAEGK